MKSFTKIFVTIFGIGYFPFAPGTLGSLIAVLIWFICIKFFSIYYFYLIIIIISIVAFVIVDFYLKYQNKDDPSEVIIDEFMGQSVPLIFIFEYNIYLVLLSFSTFRLFDIFKIYPVNKAEELNGAKGVIMDDIIAGIYSLLVIMAYKIIITI